MPFVIPTIYVPFNVNDSRCHSHRVYDPKPDVEDLHKYEEWLCEELALVRDAIAVGMYGASVTEVATEAPKEK